MVAACAVGGVMRGSMRDCTIIGFQPASAIGIEQKLANF
jgi:hypothetical protein